MSGSSYERESRRARKRRKERERRLGTNADRPIAASQAAIRDVFSSAATLEPPEPEPHGHDVTVDREVAVELHTGDSEDQPQFSEADRRPDRTADVLPESAAAQIAALQDALREKDELVTALTAQLEEAANKLDRLRREGLDRNSSVSSHKAEFGAGASDWTKSLGRLCDEWEALRLPDQLEALTSRLDGIYNLLREGAAGNAGGRDLEPPPGRPDDEEIQGRLSAWEDLKAELLREGADQGRLPKHEDPPNTLGTPDSDDLLHGLPLEPPPPVDLETADRDALATAVEERDVFISHLIRRLCSGSSVRYEPIDWAALSGAPEDLRERLQELEAQLQELLRMEECDLSLERARLARERARLEQLRRELERDSRGRADDDAAEDETDHTERRWLRVFGFGRKTDEELV